MLKEKPDYWLKLVECTGDLVFGKPTDLHCVLWLVRSKNSGVTNSINDGMFSVFTSLWHEHADWGFAFWAKLQRESLKHVSDLMCSALVKVL